MFPGARQELVHLLIGKIRVFADKISLTLKVDGLKDLASEMAVSGYFYEPHGEPEKFPETAQEVLDDGSIRMTMQLESKKIDGHRRVVIPAPGADRMKQQSLLRAIRNGQRWMEMLINGEAKNITDLAAKLGLKPPYVTRVLGLNNLAPDIVEAIVAGAEPDGLSVVQFMKTSRKTGTNNGDFSVSQNGDSGNRLAAGAILPPFLRFNGRVAAVAVVVGAVAKSSEKALVKRFCEKNFTEFLSDLK